MHRILSQEKVIYFEEGLETFFDLFLSSIPLFVVQNLSRAKVIAFQRKYGCSTLRAPTTNLYLCLKLSSIHQSGICPGNTLLLNCITSIVSVFLILTNLFKAYAWPVKVT